jgi:hypothetical protein
MRRAAPLDRRGISVQLNLLCGEPLQRASYTTA